MADEPGSEPVPLKDAVRFAFEEARVVLPGIQSLFGFQLIAVFNERFADVFDSLHQALYLVALALVALSCALAMTPAAYHRLVERGHVSQALLDRTSAFVGWAMVPLMLALSIDLGLVAYVVSESDAIALGLGLASLAVLVFLWLLFPRWARQRKH